MIMFDYMLVFLSKNKTVIPLFHSTLPFHQPVLYKNLTKLKQPLNPLWDMLQSSSNLFLNIRK